MSVQSVDGQYAAGHAWINRIAARLCAFILAAAASLSMTLSAYTEELRPTRVGAVLADARRRRPGGTYRVASGVAPPGHLAPRIYLLRLFGGVYVHRAYVDE